nr:ATP-binding protein [Desulfobulbaceae bacterium]
AALDEEDVQLVDMAVAECERRKELIISLQDFNRPTSGRLAPMDIHASINSILLLIKKECKEKGIALEIRYAQDIPQIKAVSDQIKQVLLNLFNNAIYACVKGCTITVATQRVSDEQISVTVSDTGIGIRPENLDHIFEPFFTTKPEVKGTGLGLAVSYGIIKKHGGRIEVKSEVDKGTSFVVILTIEGVKDV